jgi:hypothetical protein
MTRKKSSAGCTGSTGKRRFGAKRPKACLAGCVMLGSALETLLVLMVNVFPEEAAATGRLPKKDGKAKPL